VRVGASYVSATNSLYYTDNQYGNKAWHTHLIVSGIEPTVADTYQSLDVSDEVPPTAYAIWGNMGCSVNPGAGRGIIVASDYSI